jgi:hypothetical protein
LTNVAPQGQDYALRVYKRHTGPEGDVDGPGHIFDAPEGYLLAVAHRDPAANTVLALLRRRRIFGPTPILTKHAALAQLR